MKKTAVFYEGWGERWPLGTLADDGQRLLFEYSAEALRQGLELSPRHLALRAAAYGGFPAHQWRVPAYDLTFSTGPNGEHQMDVCGEARHIGREKMLELARLGGVDLPFAQEALERSLKVAGTLTARAGQHAIRPTTVKVMRAAIEANRSRLA